MRTSKALSKAWDLKGIPVDKYDDVISAQLSALNERLFSVTAWKLKPQYLCIFCFKYYKIIIYE